MVLMLPVYSRMVVSGDLLLLCAIGKEVLLRLDHVLKCVLDLCRIVIFYNRQGLCFGKNAFLIENTKDSLGNLLIVLLMSKLHC